MGGGFSIVDGVGGTVKAQVNAENDLQVTTPQTTAAADLGLIGLAGMTSDGTGGASQKLARYIDASFNKRIRAGVDNLLDTDAFSYAAQNSAVYQFPVTTMTITVGTGGYLLLNAGSSLASAAVARVATYKFFQLLPGGGLLLEFEGYWTLAPQTNNVIEMGWFQATGTAAPTDGVFFRLTGGGSFVGVMNYNGGELTTSALTLPPNGTDHRFAIHIENEQVLFFVDNVLLGSLPTPAQTSGPTLSSYQPVTIRTYNSSATSAAQQLKIGEWWLYSRDVNTNRPWSLVCAGMGGEGSQGQNGQTMGTTALYSNSLAVGAGAAMTNTSAALGAGLGGQFTAQPTLAAGTDGIVCSFQVPAGSAINPGKSYVCKGVTVSAICSAAITGGPLYFFFSVAYGHTAVSLATAEGAAAKAPRRIPIGIGAFVVTAALGAQMTPDHFSIEFQNEFHCNPGEFIALVAKNIGTVSSAGTITFIVNFDGYFE